jgi:hypothetical protein
VYKKFLCVLLFGLIFINTSCSSTTENKNILKKSEFSNTQKKLLDNLGLDNEIAYFKYQGKKKKVKLSVQIYKDGILQRHNLNTSFKLVNTKDIICSFQKYNDKYSKITINGASIDENAVKSYSNSVFLINPNEINLDTKEFILAIKIISEKEMKSFDPEEIFTKFKQKKEELFEDNYVYVINGTVLK